MPGSAPCRGEEHRLADQCVGLEGDDERLEEARVRRLEDRRDDDEAVGGDDLVDHDLELG